MISSSRSTATFLVGRMEVDDAQETNATSEDFKFASGYFKWTTEMDGLMLEILKEEKNKGLKDYRNFSASSYKRVVTEVNNQFGVAINKAKVINRLKTLKDQMFLACQVLKKNGFGWDETTKRIEAELEVWIEMIKADEKYKLVRGRTLHHLELFREIFEKDRATGEAAETAKEKIRRWEREKRELTIDDVDEMMGTNEVQLENLAPFESGGDTSNDTQGGSVSTSKGTKRKQPMKTAIIDEISEVTSAMNKITDAILSTSRRVWTEPEIFEAMQGLGLEGTGLLDVVDWLVAHPDLIGTFLHAQMIYVLYGWLGKCKDSSVGKGFAIGFRCLN